MGEVRQEPSYLAIQYLHETKNYPISKLCAALHIPRCSYYKWLKREKNSNELLNEKVMEWVKALYVEQNGILGYRQMTIAINRNYQAHFNKKRIRRLMRALHLQSVCRKKRYNYTPSTPEVTAENILNRDFHADKPNEKWLTDVTEFKWYRGPEVHKLYLSAILDLCDRRVVAYKIGMSNNNKLVFDTFDKAVEDMDVNMTGKVDASDAQLTYNMYNALYIGFTEEVGMEKYLRADVNADGKINVEDAAAIVAKILA